MIKFTNEQAVKILEGVRIADSVYAGDKFFCVIRGKFHYSHNLDNITENGKRGWYALEILEDL
jgi:hypothetical protein